MTIVLAVTTMIMTRNQRTSILVILIQRYDLWLFDFWLYFLEMILQTAFTLTAPFFNFGSIDMHSFFGCLDKL